MWAAYANFDNDENNSSRETIYEVMVWIILAILLKYQYDSYR